MIHDPWLGRIQHVPWLVRWSNNSVLRRLRVPTLDEALDTARSVGLTRRDRRQGCRCGRGRARIRAPHPCGRARLVLVAAHVGRPRFAHAAPDADVGLFRDTLDETAHQQLLADRGGDRGRAVSAHQDAVTPRFIAAARDRGLDVYVGYQTLGVQSERLAMTADAGLTGVVTDWPAEGSAPSSTARPPLDLSIRAMPTPTGERPSASDLGSWIVAAEARRGR